MLHLLLDLTRAAATVGLLLVLAVLLVLVVQRLAAAGVLRWLWRDPSITDEDRRALAGVFRRVETRRHALRADRRRQPRAPSS